MKDPAETTAVMSGDVPTLSLHQLARLYRVAGSCDRLFLLLGLNCGFTSGEISTLRTFEVFLETATPFIHRRRPKTGVEARWLLWPETAKLLPLRRSAPNPDHLWFLTESGRALVENLPTCRHDAVGRAWRRLWLRADLPGWMGFRFLRKTGADAIKKLGSLEDSEMYLAHQEPGLNKHYANRNWPRMWQCLERYREQLPFLGAGADLAPEEGLFS